MPILVAVAAADVVISGACEPAKVRTPAVETFKSEEITANVPPELPMATLPELEANVVAPVEESVVNAPVEAVVAPIAVELIPVAVVLKFPEVKVTLFPPKLSEEAFKPDMVNVPEVAVKFKAPVVRVNPFEAVKV